MCPCGLGCKTLCCLPWFEEARIAVREKEVLLVTRWQKHWLYGEKLVEDLGGVSEAESNSELLTASRPVVKGWFPAKCARLLENPRAAAKRRQQEAEEAGVVAEQVVKDDENSDYEIVDEDVKTSEKKDQ
jgi:hypothetical protein